jgi:hypothetical protein
MGWLRALAWWQPPCVLRSVNVNLKDDTVLRGVLWQVRGPWLVLRDAALVQEGGRVPMIGEVIIHRDNLSFVQARPPDADR